MNANLLKAELMLRGKSYDDLCKVLDTQKANLYRKIKNDNFRLYEIKLIQKEFKIDKPSIMNIFFE